MQLAPEQLTLPKRRDKTFSPGKKDKHYFRKAIFNCSHTLHKGNSNSDYIVKGSLMSIETNTETHNFLAHQKH
jgi:hypothetical protein